MGQRANLLVVRDGTHEMFYTHWNANTLDRDLFWGPRYATAFIRCQRPVPPDYWLDEVWAEGGAVLDADRGVLLFFGGEDIMFDVPRQRVHLDLMRQVWAGWDIRWAHEGIADIARHVGRAVEPLLAPHDDGADQTVLAPLPTSGSLRTVGSVVLRDGILRLYPLDYEPEEYLFTGGSLLESANGCPSVEILHVGEWTEDFPSGGFHIDAIGQVIDFWTAHPLPDIAARIAGRWPSWTVRWHRDRFESQTDRVGDALLFPQRPRELVLQMLRGILLREDVGQSSVARFLSAMESIDGAGVNVNEVNPNALRDARLDVPLAERTQIWDMAVAALDDR